MEHSTGMRPGSYVFLGGGGGGYDRFTVIEPLLA